MPTNSRQEAEWPDWKGHTAIVVASGPSAFDAQLSQAKGLAKFIAVNESWRLAYWADALYATDCRWWEKNNGVPSFGGLKISSSPRATQLFPDIKLVRLVTRPKVRIDEPGIIGCGSQYGNGHSGFHALMLAMQFGARRVVLVGFDMTLDHGLHWHRAHCLPNPDAKAVAGWRDEMDGFAGQFAGLGVEVINASPVSALKAYPKIGLMDAIAR